MGLLTFLAIILGWIVAVKMRGRIRELETRADVQQAAIDGLKDQLRRVRRDGVAPEAGPAAQEAKPREEVFRSPVVKAPEPPPPQILDAPPVAPPPPAPPVAPPPPLPPFVRYPPLPPREATPGAGFEDEVGPESEPEFEPQPEPQPEIEPAIETGPEPPPYVDPGPGFTFDWERLVGVKLFSAIAGIALVFAGVFFLRYSIDAGWLQPPVRVVIGIIVAVVLLLVCDRKAARQYTLLANAMDAAAIAILFATFFAAHSLWNLISGPQAFGLLALVTLTAVLLSIRHDSLFIAVLGLLGGFATPILLSTGENQPVPLFTYLLLLNVGLAWVSYKRGWTILSTLTLVFTTIYQWGWVAKFLDSSQVPLAIAIFTVFPLVGYGMLLAARSRAGTREHSEAPTFGWTTLAASVLPIFFALYLASSFQFRDHYALIFGWIFLIDVALFAIAITRPEQILHSIGALTTVLAVVLYAGKSFVPGTEIQMMGFVALFVGFYLAAPVIAARFDKPLEDDGGPAILAAPMVLLVFPLLAMGQPSLPLLFIPLFVLVGVIAWRAVAEERSSLFLIAAVFAIATEVVWTFKYLRPESVPKVVLTYVAFACLYAAVPHLARRRGAPLQPLFGGGVILLLNLALVRTLATNPVAETGFWAFGLLLVLFNAAVFVESAVVAMPPLAIVGGVLSWIAVAVWWSEAASGVGLLPSLLIVIGTTLVLVTGYTWALLRSRREAADEPQEWFGHGLWLALIGYFALVAVADNAAWVIPPWPLFGAIAVFALAFSTAALAARMPALHLVSTVLAALVLLTWRGHSQSSGFAEVGVVAFGVLASYALLWIRLMRVPADTSPAFVSPAATSAAVILLMQINLMTMSVEMLPARFAVTLAAHVIGYVVLLALAARHAWPYAAPAFAVFAALTAATALMIPGYTGRDILVHVGVIYAVFALYPLVLGSRAREQRDPYIAALIAGVWCFFTMRVGMERAGLEWMVGVVPVGLGAVTALHLSLLLRLQPKGERDLGRLALVAGAALGFLTVAIPLQLEEQWITIGWALEGAAVAWLYTRIPHRGLLFSGFALFGAVFVRLALNPEVFRYEPRGDMRIVNWYLYTYLIAAAAMGIGGWWLSKTDDRFTDKFPRISNLLACGATILLFLLLNIEIADYYSTGPEILFKFGASLQQDLTYTIAWLIFGIIMLAAGIIAKVRPARVASVALIAVTTFKCFLYDLGSLEGLYRVGAFVGLAISLALVSLALQKYVLKSDKESA